MKKRFLIPLIGLNLILLSSISMSLAWFAGATQLKIDGFDFTVETDPHIWISTDTKFENARDSLTTDDFGGVDKFIPVTSMTSERSKWIDDPTTEKPVFIAQYRTSSAKHPSTYQAYNGFFQKRFYLWSDRHMLATFDSENTIIKANEEINEMKASSMANIETNSTYKVIANERIAQQGITDSAKKTQMYESVKDEVYNSLKEKYLQQLNSVEDSLRISILDYENLGNSNYTIIDPHKNGSTVFGGRLNTSKSKSYYDFYVDHSNNNELKEILFGDIKEGKDYEPKYLPAASEDVHASGTLTCFNSGTRKGVRALDMEDVAKNITFYEEQSVTPEFADVSVSKNESQGYLVELWPDTPHLLVLSVYLEGWDRDNTDLTQDATFDVSVKFKLYREGDFI